MITEDSNPNSENLDLLETAEMLRTFNREDASVAGAIETALEQIAHAVDSVSDRLKRGGRLIYVGAGTSGRLGVLDAAECPPTFGVESDLVQAVLAGGPDAVFKSIEGAEDEPEAGAEALRQRKVGTLDAVVGIAASGTTPFTLGAVRYARSRKALTIGLTCNRGSPLTQVAEIPIEVVTGPEAITGSTRLKAGTAQKMVLNMISSAAMIRLGHVYGNLMINVRPSSRKLQRRAARIVMVATGCSLSEAEELLGEAPDPATAIVMKLAGCSALEAQSRLRRLGTLRRVLDEVDHSCSTPMNSPPDPNE